ncbi:MAG: hypothetical protein ACR2J8_09870 [Thermomicrobiales bacterium]
MRERQVLAGIAAGLFIAESTVNGHTIRPVPLARGAITRRRRPDAGLPASSR